MSLHAWSHASSPPGMGEGPRNPGIAGCTPGEAPRQEETATSGLAPPPKALPETALSRRRCPTPAIYAASRGH